MAEDERIAVIGEAETDDGGIVRLSQWLEGYVLWYHGEIVWKSWEKPRGETVSQLVVKLDGTEIRRFVEAEIAKVTALVSQDQRKRRLAT